ncbi:hypothetical protein DFO73_11878 [Cytobacillus oceanisediminis]|jgi:hypothetical protein|uniref:Uncharacterized protein n=1 Tax=Cytobacillus oceanisediminis TaxID=665099 RepID=A0A2V2ZJR9_9BACI|nr:hypothetical protein DFO73_11878 [Cytobacillus oceanisediminis]
MGITMIKISTVYFAAGVMLGYYMSSTHSYLLAPFHVHINLLGWTSLTLQGFFIICFRLWLKRMQGNGIFGSTISGFQL